MRVWSYRSNGKRFGRLSSKLNRIQSTSASLANRDAGTGLLYIVTQGRVSRRRHVVKTRFVRWNENSVCVLVAPEGKMSPDWIENLFANVGGDSSFLASASTSSSSSSSTPPPPFGLYGRITRASIILDEGEAKAVTDRFFEKYGADFARRHDSRYYKNARPVVLEFEPLRDDLRLESLVAELEFDIQAKNYDLLILGNPISRWQRQVTVRHLFSLFKPGSTVLEIGCGTGIETIPLAKNGVKVIALDISERMLQVLDRKARLAGVESQIKSRRNSSSNLIDLLKDAIVPPSGFDGAFSHFGAVNLENDLGRFSRDLSCLLRQGALVSFAVWNRICLIELLADSLRGKLGRLRARTSGLVRTGEESRYSLDTATYTPREFSSYFKNEFEVLSHFALPAFIPPSEYAARFSWSLKFKRGDAAIGKLPLIRDLGDNFVMTMRKL